MPILWTAMRLLVFRKDKIIIGRGLTYWKPNQTGWLSSTICSSVYAAPTATPAWVFASLSLTPARAAIIGSQGWSPCRSGGVIALTILPSLCQGLTLL